MKQLTCEMCGSTDLLKLGGIFVCQTCGTKYSVEEAKKMMVEGTVDVSGSTVTVDTSVELDNLYQIARRAKDDNNAENARKYYDMILLKDPTSWEAAFYVVYFKAMECKIAEIRSAAISVSNCEESVLKLIKNNVPEGEQATAVNEVMLRSCLIADMLANGAENYYNGISADIQDEYTQEFVDNTYAALNIMYTCGSKIDTIFNRQPKISRLAVKAWKGGVELHKQFLPNFANELEILSYVKKIGKYDPNYAKQYNMESLERKKIALETIITHLNKTISNTRTDSNSTLIVVGIIVFILSWIAANYVWKAHVGTYVGVVITGIGFAIKPSKSTIEFNKKKVAEAKKELEKVLAEKAEIEKKLEALK